MLFDFMDLPVVFHSIPHNRELARPDLQEVLIYALSVGGMYHRPPGSGIPDEIRVGSSQDDAQGTVNRGDPGALAEKAHEEEMPPRGCRRTDQFECFREMLGL